MQVFELISRCNNLNVVKFANGDIFIWIFIKSKQMKNWKVIQVSCLFLMLTMKKMALTYKIILNCELALS